MPATCDLLAQAWRDDVQPREYFAGLDDPTNIGTDERLSVSAPDHLHTAHALALMLNQDRDSRQLVARLPVDILRVIFLTAHTGGLDDVDQFPRNPYQTPVVLSLTLAAVCSEWRSVAIPTASLWATVVIPQPDGDSSSRLAGLVNLLLSRSRHWPLSIFLLWDTYGWDDGTVAPILSALAAHTARWRLFHLRLKAGIFPCSIYNILRRPTPLLENFCLLRAECDALEWDAHKPDLLTVCPKLHRFRSENSSVIFAIPPSSLTNLVHLELDVNLTCATVWDHLRYCVFLEILDIVFAAVPEDAEDVQENQLTLPRLRSLSPCACTAQMLAVNSAKVSFPVLESIAVTPGTLLWMTPIFRIVQHTLRRLDLLAFNTLTAQHALCLSPLVRLQHLSLSDRCNMLPEFLRALSAADAQGEWIMPSLEMLNVRSLGEASGEDFVLLVSSRNASNLRDGRPQNIRNVLFEYPDDVPHWVISQTSFHLRA